jgi:hypothetical protein
MAQKVSSQIVEVLKEIGATAMMQQQSYVQVALKLQRKRRLVMADS